MRDRSTVSNASSGWIAFAKRPLKKLEFLSAVSFSSGDADVEQARAFVYSRYLWSTGGGETGLDFGIYPCLRAKVRFSALENKNAD